MTDRSYRVRVLAGVAMLAGSATSLAQPTDFNYVRRETREASREATLAQYMTSLTVDDWFVIGPFENAGRDRHDVVYAPEQEIDLSAQYAGKNGAVAGWERIEDDAWSRIELKRFGDEAMNTDAIAYLHRVFEAPNDASIEFEMGSDDGLKVWVNGRLIVDADTYRGFNIQDHVVTVPVRAGRNEVLVKVTQGVGGWEFQMQPRFDSRVLSLMEYYLNRDFPRSRELAHYRPLTVLEPEDVALEIGGLDVMPDGRPIMSTRRGEVWIADGAYDDPPFNATFTRFAFGLHEPLGGLWHDGGFMVTQRGEVTKLVDTNGDDVADRYETASAPWGVSGNYHEFAFGPELDGQGRLWVTLNVGFCGSLGKSIVPWRGWAMRVEPDGSLTPVCGGLRSPNTMGRNAAGDMFCCDNQGDWVATNKLMHLDTGDWHGHPSSRRWYEQAGMRTPADDEYKPPAVWFPYDRMGRSASDILLDDTGGAFGPFDGQLFVGDQFEASIMRVFLERVNGVYQGACFAFLEGLDSGVNRMCWGRDGSMFVGMTNRGWWSKGPRQWGLQRVVYTGTVPFEVQEMRVRRDGFELLFTTPVDRASAASVNSYTAASFRHERWEQYGAPETDRRAHLITRADVADDLRTVRLYFDSMRPGFVHELTLGGVRDANGDPLVHDLAFYTLNVLP